MNKLHFSYQGNFDELPDVTPSTITVFPNNAEYILLTPQKCDASRSVTSSVTNCYQTYSGNNVDNLKLLISLFSSIDIPETFTSNQFVRILQNRDIFTVNWNNRGYSIIKKVILYNPFICHLFRLDPSHKCSLTPESEHVSWCEILVDNGVADELHFIRVVSCSPGIYYNHMTSIALCCDTLIYQYKSNISKYLCITNPHHMTRYYNEISINCNRCCKRVQPNKLLCYDCANTCEVCKMPPPCACKLIMCQFCGFDTIIDNIIFGENTVCKICNDILNHICVLCGLPDMVKHYTYKCDVLIDDDGYFIIEDPNITFIKYSVDSFMNGEIIPYDHLEFESVESLDSVNPEYELRLKKFNILKQMAQPYKGDERYKNYYDVTIADTVVIPDKYIESTRYMVSFKSDWILTNHHIIRTQTDTDFIDLVRCYDWKNNIARAHLHCLRERLPLKAILVKIH